MARSVSRTCRTVNSVHRWSTSQLTMRQTCAKHAPNMRQTAKPLVQGPDANWRALVPLPFYHSDCNSFQHVPSPPMSIIPTVSNRKCWLSVMTHDSYSSCSLHALFMLSSCSLHAFHVMVSITGLGHIVKVHSNKMHPQLCKLCLTRDPNLTIKGLGRAWTGLGHLGARGYVSRIGVHWRLWRTWAWCGFVHLDWRFGHQSLCAQNECCATWKNVQCLTRNQHLRACSILLHLLLLQVNFVNFSVLKLSSALLFGDAALRALPRAEPHQVPQNRQRLSFWSIWSIWSWSVGMLQNWFGWAKLTNLIEPKIYTAWYINKYHQIQGIELANIVGQNVTKTYKNMETCQWLELLNCLSPKAQCSLEFLPEHKRTKLSMTGTDSKLVAIGPILVESLDSFDFEIYETFHRPFNASSCARSSASRSCEG